MAVRIVITGFDNVERSMKAATKQALNEITSDELRFLKEKSLWGITGDLKNSWRHIRATERGNVIEASVYTNLWYARIQDEVELRHYISEDRMGEDTFMSAAPSNQRYSTFQARYEAGYRESIQRGDFHTYQADLTGKAQSYADADSDEKIARKIEATFNFYNR